jgi:adenylosuccinate synthase
MSNNKQVTVVLGSQFGDEGKGKLVDYLIQRDVNVCSRFNGGNNAGHSIQIGSRSYHVHLLPSGILTPTCVNVIGNGVVVHIAALVAELASVDLTPESARGRLLISDRAHVVFDFHQVVDGLIEASLGDKKLGTTKRGIGPAYADKAGRRGLRIADVLDASFESRFNTLVATVRREWGADALAAANYDPAAELAKLLVLREQIRPLVTDTGAYLAAAVAAGKSVLVEGANAVMLDIDHGTYPFVTSSSPSIGGASIGLGIPANLFTSVVGVVKAYTSRVGEGPFPTENKDAPGQHMQKVGREFGTSTGRPRRCGWLDLNIVGYAHRLNGFTAINITKLDILSGIPELKLGVSYTLDGKPVPFGSVPARLDDLGRCQVVYETFPGWTEDISTCTRVADLPANAQAYLARIEQVLGVRAKWIGVGAGRDQTIVVD